MVKVLVVEDEIALRETLTYNLARQGYGEIALKFIKSLYNYPKVKTRSHVANRYRMGMA
jgi:DNA-binding NtrC family response regulator